MSTNKKNTVANVSFLTIGALIIFPFLYMLLDRSPCLTFVGESRIVPDVVRPGMDVSIQWRVIELRHCGGLVVDRQILGAAGGIHPVGPPVPTVLRNLKPGPVLSSRDITIPLSLPNGLAVYQATVNRWAVYEIFGQHFPNFVQKWWFPMVDVRPPIPFMVQRK